MLEEVFDMSVLDNFGQWKDFLADRLHQGQQEGMEGTAVNEMAYQIGDYLAEQVDPKNNEERLLKQLWECSSEEEQHVLANVMVRLVQNDGTNH
jgi:cell shape-determining protein MreC